jgi:hypothetical protein
MSIRRTFGPGRTRRGRAALVAILAAVPLALLSAAPAAADAAEGSVVTVVRDAATGAPVPGVTVHVIAAGDRFADLWSSRGSSDANGVVAIDNLPAERFSFFVEPGDGVHGMQWLGARHGTGDRDAALVVSVPAGGVLTLPDIRLDPAGSITGRLINDATGEPVSAQVSVASIDPLWQETTPNVFGNGQYTFAGLGPYGWKLFFMPAGSAGFTSQLAAQWSGGVPDRHRARRIHVRPGRATVADQRLRPGTVVTGNAVGGPTVTGPIYAFHAGTHEILAVSDDADSGRYAVRLLPGQFVKLCIWKRWCYPNGASLDDATPVWVGRRPLVVDLPGPPAPPVTR